MSAGSLKFMRFFTVLLLVYGVLARAEYSGPTVQSVENLRSLGGVAAEKKVPIVMVVTQSGCSYCELLKEEIIQPTLLSGEYDGRAIFRELVMDDRDDIIGFTGKPRQPGEVAQDYEVWVTPTVLYLDSNGKEIAERALGINSVDYYGYYMDEEIKKALKILRK